MLWTTILFELEGVLLWVSKLEFSFCTRSELYLNSPYKNLNFSSAELLFIKNQPIDTHHRQNSSNNSFQSVSPGLALRSCHIRFSICVKYFFPVPSAWTMVHITVFSLCHRKVYPHWPQRLLSLLLICFTDPLWLSDLDPLPNTHHWWSNENW